MSLLQSYPVETRYRAMLEKKYIFAYVLAFSFFWRYLIVFIFKLHPLQDRFQTDNAFDGALIFTIGFVSCVLASICVVLAEISRRLTKAGSMSIISVVWAMGVTLLHGDIILPLLFSLVWRVWISDMYMIGQLYLAWIPAAVAGPVLWWFLLKRLERKNIIVGGDGVIDDELVRGNK